MIKQLIQILSITFALLGIANFAVADDVYYCVGDSQLDGETTRILTISREKQTLQLEVTYPLRMIGPRTQKKNSILSLKNTFVRFVRCKC